MLLNLAPILSRHKISTGILGRYHKVTGPSRGFQSGLGRVGWDLGRYGVPALGVYLAGRELGLWGGGTSPPPLPQIDMTGYGQAMPYSMSRMSPPNMKLASIDMHRLGPGTGARK